MDIPDFLSHLPTHGGLPVPFTVMYVNGIPDFRVVDHDKRRACMTDRLCAICGRRLGEYAWFIGGPKSLEMSNLFMDPPQHEHCARFAIATCPFLSGQVTEHNRAKPIPPEASVEPLITSTRSEKIGMRRTKQYGLVNYQGHGLIKVIRWHGLPIWLA
jgi:hypothetical protein